ncbi:hypothetical protein C1645_829878 [Glomus cerebriforme]|uniref:Uncharacterized protein n=1 Tax=Glomus cerebriforme TaxID=658196 RepID=A0A397ST56_9GLOM|nr:hypothetical protein C1645_829878 [Glomus cerebriforme]
MRILFEDGNKGPGYIMERDYRTAVIVNIHQADEAVDREVIEDSYGKEHINLGCRCRGKGQSRETWCFIMGTRQK